MTRPLPDLANDLRDIATYVTTREQCFKLIDAADVIELVHDLFDSTRPNCDTCKGVAHVSKKDPDRGWDEIPCPDPFCDRGRLDMGEHLRRIAALVDKWSDHELAEQAGGYE